ncbi:hypothetical protein RFI_22591 [Reticulomyxa filosa]|uniref:Adenosine 3'-phospho 5'-phosphosulfate transporter 1 n=1 Tax=Reticulomyxa filosa TaxID=46433 RepID=X6ML83_RETFI|nr:hypothetical protein RFI_22591 [Reticulomyxa filosa]|eukprot:ETO14778.1 hypothetical protein RFI_22591 [Reticulomyxa filosa]
MFLILNGYPWPSCLVRLYFFTILNNSQGSNIHIYIITCIQYSETLFFDTNPFPFVIRQGREGRISRGLLEEPIRGEEKVLIEEDESAILQQRLANDVTRTIQFLSVFGTFCVLFCGLSYKMYQKPYDSPQGNTLVSKIRRMAFFGWFFRQPMYAQQVETVVAETEIEPLAGSSPKNFLEEGGKKKKIYIHEKKKKDTNERKPHAISDVVLSVQKEEDTEKKHVPGKRSNVNKLMTIKPGAYIVCNSANMTLLCCGLLLLIAYLIWGFFQERIMAHPYGDGSDERNWFKSSEFLVLVNRAFGLAVSSIVIRYTKCSGFDCPPYYYGMSALSNMSSSWLQYESLHYVTFPVQTVFKSAKVLVTMLVSTLMGKKHTLDQYLSAIFVGVGVYLFLMSQRTDGKEREMGWYFYLGLVLVSAYALTDAFTSNWQQKVFNETKISSFEMMQGTNAVTFVVSLIFALPSIPQILQFYITHPLIITHSIVVGLSAGFGIFFLFVYENKIGNSKNMDKQIKGQILIFYTVENFGAVKLAAVMTARMVVSVLLSIVYYGHPVSMTGIVGMFITFAALFYSILFK